MNLFLDVGNTAAKWRVRQDDLVRQGGVTHERDWRALVSQIKADLNSVDIHNCYAVSVAGRDSDAALSACFELELNIVPEFYYSQANDFGVENSYAEPERMGVDRWVALIEAKKRGPGAAIVIDCGSAITIDGLDADGVHVGGYIVPGMRMMEASLLAKTASVRFAAHETWESMDFGHSTAECVQNGILRMAVSFIEETVVALQKRLQDTCSVYVTGGDAKGLLPWFADQEWLVLPDMVLDGLERVFPLD